MNLGDKDLGHLQNNRTKSQGVVGDTRKHAGTWCWASSIFEWNGIQVKQKLCMWYLKVFSWQQSLNYNNKYKIICQLKHHTYRKIICPLCLSKLMILLYYTLLHNPNHPNFKLSQLAWCYLFWWMQSPMNVQK